MLSILIEFFDIFHEKLISHEIRQEILLISKKIESG